MNLVSIIEGVDTQITYIVLVDNKLLANYLVNMESDYKYLLLFTAQ